MMSVYTAGYLFIGLLLASLVMPWAIKRQERPGAVVMAGIACVPLWGPFLLLAMWDAINVDGGTKSQSGRDTLDHNA